MQNTGKFIAIASVFGGAMDSAGRILSRDTHGLPPIWLNVIAGSIPNRQTLTGSVAQRAGILMDDNGVISRGQSQGNPFGKVTFFGQWLHTGDDDRYGPQYSWIVIQNDLSPKEIMELEPMLGTANVFTVARPELPEGYEKKTNQHVSPRRLDPAFHGTQSTFSNPVEKAREDLGNFRSDTKGNPEVTVQGNQSTEKLNAGDKIS